MFTINPLYGAIAGGVLVLGVTGTIVHQGHQIHKYHTLFNCVNEGADCEKNSKLITVPQLRAQIAQMTAVQNEQTKISDQNIAKVITVRPEIKVVQDKFKKEPLPPNCETPDVPAELEPVL